MNQFNTHCAPSECVISVSPHCKVSVYVTSTSSSLSSFDTARPPCLCLYVIEQRRKCISECKNASLSTNVFLQAISDWFLERKQFTSCFCWRSQTQWPYLEKGVLPSPPSPSNSAPWFFLFATLSWHKGLNCPDSCCQGAATTKELLSEIWQEIVWTEKEFSDANNPPAARRSWYFSKHSLLMWTFSLSHVKEIFYIEWGKNPISMSQKKILFLSL